MHDKKKTLLEIIQYCVSELTITGRSGVVEHSHPPITEYLPWKQKKKNLNIKRNGKIVSTTDNYHYNWTIIKKKSIRMKRE